ncbi:4-diphosphocytidyl-2-C-methyl-D-erythritol kinase [Kingella potus]|uniref:4-diphosphocytidyl-2-C-methyl-D-erythritol kinase n=1 Tax=Kingella potus TaxID=265175 RepID=A0A377R1U6_9NEIS|nr:4-(cytidine 5'-diphospho)-2-C-methyl-D-erythritol kinase [Kingella potus]STR00281.1 4-diphosphocytidyl-2-C-methyl-D-erythritol kinase [Kingella potus]
MNTAAAEQAFPAPAKLNLDLRITGRRADGYHELESIFCLIGWQDTVWLALRTDGMITLSNPTGGLHPEQDLAYRAAAAMRPYGRTGQGVSIRLDKQIPTGGGLGGGSSDAASVMLALNRLWQCGLKREELVPIGAKLGADVPFFLFGRNAFARGIGEKLSVIDVPQQWYVIVKPPVHIATAAIFSHPNLTRNSAPAIMPTFRNLQPFRNDMQAVVLAEYEAVAEVYETLNAFGAARMTGSGSCIFLSFENEDAAQAAYREISVLYPSAKITPGLERHPLYGYAD